MDKNDTYVIHDQMGNCQVCGAYKDLRYGVCFKCADRVMCDNKGICTETKTGKQWHKDININ